MYVYIYYNIIGKFKKYGDYLFLGIFQQMYNIEGSNKNEIFVK